MGGDRIKPAALVALVATAAVLGAFGAPAAAAATTTTVDCSSTNPLGTSTTDSSQDLQDVLSADDSSTGDTVIIDGLCTGSFDLPIDASQFTLEGAQGTPSGFDGQGSQQQDSMLYGDDTIDGLTLASLVFQNAVAPVDTGDLETSAPDPSALELYVSNGTLTLTGDTFNNNSDLNNPAVYLESDWGSSDCESADNSIDIANSRFTNGTLTQAGDDTSFYNAPGGGGGLELALYCEQDSVTLTGNTFAGNVVDSTDGEAPAVGGGLSIIGVSPDASAAAEAVTQSDNTFNSNAVDAPSGDDGAFWGGGGEWAQGVQLQSSGDTFSDNVLPGSDYEYLGSSGAGLDIEGDCGSEADDFVQNVGATLNQDVFADNVIAASSNGSDDLDYSYGAAIGDDPYSVYEYYGVYYGLYVLYDGDCSGEFYYGGGPDRSASAGLSGGPAGFASAARQSGVVKGNDTLDPDAIGNVTLNDSTVNGNAVTDGGVPSTDSFATAGIAGGDASTLDLNNTILNGDVGGSETSYFGEPSGGPKANGTRNAAALIDTSLITAAYSDFCDPNNPGSPFAGTGNICADPKLVDDGYTPPPDIGAVGENTPGSITVGSVPNVQQTSSSPTLDAGSNSLVPSGITTDIYGNAREVGKACPVGAGTVDIGAAEFVPTCTTTTTTVSTPPPPAATPTPQPSKVLAPCTSRRAFLVHMHFQFRIPSGVTLLKVRAQLTSTTVPNFGTKTLTAFGSGHELVRVDLKKYPFGTYKLSLHITESSGRQVSTHDIYHTCRTHPIHYPPHPLPSIVAG